MTAKQLIAPLMLSCLGLAACTSARFHETRTLSAPAQSRSALTVRTTNGSVKVAGVERDDVAIVAELRAITEERLKGAKIIAAAQSDGSMLVTVDWPDGGPKNDEGCSFDIRVPDAIGLTILSSNGSISASGMAGKAELTTSNGSITISDHAGPVVATSSNGSVTAEGVTEQVTAETSNGSIRATDIGGPVLAHSSNGGIVIKLAGDCKGPVTARTSNGNVSLTVGPGFSGKTTMKTSNGRVSVTGVSASDKSELDKTSGWVRIGGGDSESQLKTTNGNVSVTVAPTK